MDGVAETLEARVTLLDFQALNELPKLLEGDGLICGKEASAAAEQPDVGFDAGINGAFDLVTDVLQLLALAVAQVFVDQISGQSGCREAANQHKKGQEKAPIRL